MTNILVTSEAFESEGMIPKKYTCDGADASPPIAWTGAPDNTVSIALICDDPDAPMGTWVHWVLYNLPPSTTTLAEGVPPVETLDGGGVHGITDFKRIGYGGPCPPGGTHRYLFKVYALSARLDLKAGATKAQLEKAMEGFVVAQGELAGKYRRKLKESS
jgi:Raf kinase inhibitor-like YbhB/YbcL family protein